MRPIDWAVMFGWIALLVGWGMYRGRGSNTVNQFLLAGKTMPWYAMGLSIMATQASAITFISTTALGYSDGMRFVQFYFGLPIAMVILCATAVPIFHRAKVYTAYEYLESRFDAKTRALVTAIFLISRGLQCGVALAAPAITLSIVLGWPFQLTVAIMGGLMILYTTSGGIKAVTWADVPQMFVILAALIAALITAIRLLPPDVSFLDAVHLAGAAGKINIVTTHFDWNDRYNLFSGLIGGSFLFLAYFGTDQSQVQRYLTGKSVGQSRLSLLLNAMAKVPMQAMILFIGAMVFVFFLFVKPPIIFHPAEAQRVEQSDQYAGIAATYDQAFTDRRAAAIDLKNHQPGALERFRAAESRLDAARTQATTLGNEKDTNYIFLSFVTHYLPAGVVGLALAVIFTAAMSASSGEINSLATVSVVDIYRRHIHRDASDRHYLFASRTATVFWGLFAICFASFARSFGALIETVNVVGSLFYGTMLGVFVLAFFVKRVNGTAAFAGVIAGQIAIFAVAWLTNIAWLWYNAVGCLVAIAVAWAISLMTNSRSAIPGDSLPDPA
ncbi:MAG TPA: sodium:solute symporter [Bryobacteraceae bacterium]|nr:sodium:solute symporter [Bryobacteraceae bacterium]